MGDHLKNNRKDGSKHHKRGYSESVDLMNQRARRVSFKKYVEQLEEELLDAEDDLDEDDDQSR